jgi:hypothetical protein
LLNNVSNSASDVHVHAGLLPNERDGMSAILLRTPSMCSGVNGQVCVAFSRNASAWISCSATTDRLDANRVTKLTVGELSLNKVTRFSRRLSQTPSIASQSITSPAISKLEFVSLPVGLVEDTMSCFMSSGHSQWNTTGVHAVFSPSTNSPAPCPDASTIPI